MEAGDMKEWRPRVILCKESMKSTTYGKMLTISYNIAYITLPGKHAL